ncbi:restriction endonuclease [Rhodococcoides yunnanense]|uniref:nSTAND3 domain-containing NTPase n=1 Tax=Rhodococcoides yunnanense TaxID=278209 RepID=UPI000932E161|nr:restriction endonuclease [Rhodococcus yunnanensis]
MPEYDFHTLSPTDFEMLVRDLLEEELGKPFEAFANGPDGGVDLRCTSNQITTVVQCKHYRGSTFSDLKRSAAKEKGKMDTLGPDEYYFATSQDLTITQKDTLKQTLHPHISNSNQILAARDLNKLLGLNPKVEQRHFKLWMASAGVIKRIVLSGLWERSEALMEEMQDRIRLYVSTDSYSSARETLHKHRVCVVTGPPGVGKSMLADMIALTHWDSGWQIVNLSSHEISNSWDAWDSDSKQLFYFDDIFGQTDIQERLGNDNGPTLSRLIGRVRKSTNKLIIVTSRMHVLKDAIRRDEPLERAGLTAYECVVRIQEYTPLHRAKILYNHLYFSDIPRDVIRQFCENLSYQRINGHRNFTPRIIEQVLAQYSGTEARELEEKILSALENPVMLWGGSFRESLPESSRLLLMHLVSFPPSGADLSELREVSIRSVSPMRYTERIKNLEGSWIKIGTTSYHDIEPKVQFNDPSCRDFVLWYLNSEPTYAIDIIRNASSLNQISQIVSYAASVNGEDTTKYPTISKTLLVNNDLIFNIARSLWDRTPAGPDSWAVEKLGSISRIAEILKIDAGAWIAEQFPLLLTKLREDPSIDSSAAARVADALINNYFRPFSSAESLMAVRLLSAWRDDAYESDQWDRTFEFQDWLQRVHHYIPSDEDQTHLHGQYRQWLTSELDAVMDNSSNQSDAKEWIEQVKSNTDIHFDLWTFDDQFDEYMDKVDEKWPVYEPYIYDEREAHSADAVTQSGGGSSALVEIFRKSEDAPRTEARIIADLFTQLS